jgi:hypothetical protein
VTDNPLSKYYVQPGTFVKLPSGGRYYEDPPTITADGEIEVKPMNAMDELQFQSPDGLLNNDSLAKVLGKTVPGIKDPATILRPDLDVLLIALRVVTYGDTMDVEVECPHCNNKDQYSVDLSRLLAGAKDIEAPDQVEVNGLKVNIRPFTLFTQNKLNEYMIDIQRTARELAVRQERSEDQLDALEELRTKMSASLNASSLELFNIAVNSIISVETPDEQIVTDADFINEWLNNLKAPEYKIIREGIKNLSEERVDRKMTVKCTNCEKSVDSEVNFDPANFFATG